MKLIPRLLQNEGWYLTGAESPIQVGVKSGATPFSAKHLHRTMVEYFLLLKGDLRLRVNGETIEIGPGDLLVVEAGEAHEVLQASPDALLLLFMPPAVADDKVEFNS